MESTSSDAVKMSNKLPNKKPAEAARTVSKAKTQKKSVAQKKPALTMSVVDNVAVIVFNQTDKKVNTLNSKLMPEFEELIDRVAKEKDIIGSVLISGKDNCFIAGADIEELASCKNAKEATDLSQKGQRLFSKIENSTKPIVAAISGSCLGGGLELAMACHYRIASDNSKTVLGLPEVMLGLLPGAGGTQRLPRLIGLQKALPMMLTGAPLKAVKAFKLGLVDYVTLSKELQGLAISAVHKLINKELKSRRKDKQHIDKLLEETSMGRDLVFKKATDSVTEKTRGLYPAPFAIIEAVKMGIKHNKHSGFKKEAEEFGRLSQTREAKGLMSLYFAQNELKKNLWGEVKQPAKHIGILGAGLMGSGIGVVSSQKNFSVRIKDISDKALERGQKDIYKELDKKVKRRRLTAFDRDRLLSKITMQTNFNNFKDCDLVVEAVFEDISLKHRVVAELEAVMRDDAVLASNTSALPISDIAAMAKHPERIIGMHYFSPVPKMPLLEIITTKKTSKEATALAFAVGQKQGKTVIVVNDGPGFYTTRVLAPYSDEAATVLLEGYNMKELDSAMLLFGFPVGPIKLMDEVGIDVAQHVASSLGRAFGPRVATKDTGVLDAFIKGGLLGRKSGQGFYLYNSTKSSPLSKFLPKGSSKEHEINPKATAMIRAKSKTTSTKHIKDVTMLQKRLTYRLINEAAYCLQEGIIRAPVDGDVGAVFGIGFPPMTGGPFRYTDHLGVKAVSDDLKRFHDTYGERFAPAQILLDMAKSGKSFYS